MDAPRAFNVSTNSIPLVPGIRTSVTTQAPSSGGDAFRKASADAKPRTRMPVQSSRNSSEPRAPSSSSKSLADSAELVGGRRRRSLGDSSGYVSTDSEWEKVSDQEGKL